jgi:hypothetical protein
MRRILAVSALMAGVASAGGTSDAELTAGARDWLTLVDAAHYEQAWSRTASNLRNGTDREHWTAAIRSQRRDDGAATCRKTITLERAADASRVIALFVSEFADGHRIGEKVTLSADGTQILDYRVGPAAIDHGAPCAATTTPEPLQ